MPVDHAPYLWQAVPLFAHGPDDTAANLHYRLEAALLAYLAE